MVHKDCILWGVAEYMQGPFVEESRSFVSLSQNIAFL